MIQMTPVNFALVTVFFWTVAWSLFLIGYAIQHRGQKRDWQALYAMLGIFLTVAVVIGIHL